MAENKDKREIFAYHTEDLSCRDCLHRINKSKRKNPNTGCGENLCRYTDILVDTLVSGRVKRKRGHFAWDK